MRKVISVLVLAGMVALAVAGILLATVHREADEAMVNVSTLDDQNNGQVNMPLLMLWNLVYGYDWTSGTCKGGPDSVGWERPQERVFPPEAGYYCSSDPAYIATAIEQMKTAGVTTLLLSWHGWGDVDFDGNIEAVDFVGNTNAVLNVFRHLKDHEPGMQAAIMVEPFFLNADPKILPDDVSVDQKQTILNYVWDNFYGPFPDQVFQREGKPLIVNWKNNEGRWLLDETEDSRFSYREWGVIEEGADWEFTAHQGLEGMKIGPDGAIWIAPRFDEFHLWNQGAFPDKEYDDLVRLDPYLEEGLYDQAWEKVYEHRSAISMVMLYGWNPWAEAASLEPARPYGDLLLRKTAWYYKRLVSGEPYQHFGTGEIIYPDLWSQPEDLKQFVGNLDGSELGLSANLSVDQFLAERLREAQSLIESRIGRPFFPGNVPAGVKHIQLRLAANIYNYILLNKRDPVMQVGEFNFRLNDDAVFTEALKSDLAPWRKSRGIKVLFP